MNTLQFGVYVNANGGKFPVKILSMHEKTEHFPGGGNPFSVTSVDVLIEFDNPIDPRFGESRTMQLSGYPRDGYIGFYGACADSGIRSRLELTTPNPTPHPLGAL